MKIKTNRRLRWGVPIALIAILFASATAWWLFKSRGLQPWGFLAHVVQTEQSGVNQTNVQLLGWSLTALGRDHEVREMDYHPQFELPPSRVDTDNLALNVVPWRVGVGGIAADHQVVMIMENHMTSKHREFICRALEAFRDAGFSHYAAEAIYESAESLMKRGYPISQTGLYTSDPQFGNLLRRALELDFEVLGYDHSFSSHEGREEYAAKELARILSGNGKNKLVVHAGPGHVLKHKDDLGYRWLASLLWEKTGIEPFTIWQWSSQHDSLDYAKVVRVLEERGILTDEPIMLMPPPNDAGFRDPLYSPDGLPNIDAVLVHPQDRSVAPAERTTLFPDVMQRLAGRWITEQWPIVVSAYKKGEPTDAVPLDQTLLRGNESDFVLWIPKRNEYEIRVFNKDGVLPSVSVIDNSGVVTVEAVP